MPINRAPFNALVDDNGTGLTGSIWNKAAIASVILDPADAAYVSPTLGTFTISDASGAGLVIGNAAACTYYKIGRLVTFWIQPVWPSTANTANVLIGGFPFVVAGGNPIGGAYQTLGPTPLMGYMTTGGTAISLFGATGNAIRNVDISGQNFILQGQYLTN
jgi:hypothetical protein